MSRWYSSPVARTWTIASPPSGARAFHRSLPGYEPTPLIPVPALATELGVGRVLVKDESSRLGLPAFKVLGASWACHRALEEHPGARLVTATDGNHGRAVARTAARLGVGATVFVPSVMRPEPAALIAGEGADVVRVDGDYDTDAEALRAVDDLGSSGISSGPSAAATLAGVRVAFADAQRRAALDVGPDSIVVLLSTEARPPEHASEAG